jgi:hypothetical protein
MALIKEHDVRQEATGGEDARGSSSADGISPFGDTTLGVGDSIDMKLHGRPVEFRGVLRNCALIQEGASAYNDFLVDVDGKTEAEMNDIMRS